MPRTLRIGTFLSDSLRPFYAASAEAIGEALEVESELVTGESFDDLIRGELDFAFICGLPYVNLRDDGVGIEPVVAPSPGDPRYEGKPWYFSDVVVRRGSEGEHLEDFARIAVNEPNSHSGWSVVLAAFDERGVPMGGFDEVFESGAHAVSLQAVRDGRVDAAAIDSHVLTRMRAEDPGIDEELEVIEALGPSPSQPLVASPEVAPGDEDLVRAALTGMTDAWMTWVAVDDSTYDPIRLMRDRAVERGGF